MKTKINRVNVLAFGCLTLVLSVAFASLFIMRSPGTSHAASLPGGLWVSPTTDNNSYEPGIWYTIKARAYSPAGVDHVNFTAGDPWNRWYILCSPTQPDPGTVDTYSCQTDFRPTGVYFGGGTIHLSFDVYGKDGGLNQAPNGERTEHYNWSRLGGVWNSPNDGTTYQVGDHIRFSANAYPSDGGHPIDHVAFTSNSGGSWHTVCTQGYPNVHEFGCDWYPKASDAGDVQISFDVYTTNPGEASYAPNGVHTLHIKTVTPPVKPGGVWVNSGPSTMEPGIWYTLKARAYPTNPGDPAIDHVNFTGYWGGSWHLICQTRTIDAGTQDQYSCQTDFRYANGMNYPPSGWLGLSFDVYGKSGNVNWGPNGIHWNTYKASSFGGVWNTPGNHFSVSPDGNLHLSAWAYPSNNGPALDSVHFTGFWSGSWHTICRAGPGADGDGHEYACDFTPSNSGVPIGQFQVSFDVYDANGNVKWGPNGIHYGTLLSIVKPGGVWKNPTSAGSVYTQGNRYQLVVQAYPKNQGDPSISYVNFTAYWNGAWHTLCRTNAPSSGNYYFCNTNFNVGGFPPNGPLTLSFDVYDHAGNLNLAPNGLHIETFKGSSTKSLLVTGMQTHDSTWTKSMVYLVRAMNPRLIEAAFEVLGHASTWAACYSDIAEIQAAVTWAEAVSKASSGTFINDCGAGVDLSGLSGVSVDLESLFAYLGEFISSIPLP